MSIFFKIIQQYSELVVYAHFIPGDVLNIFPRNIQSMKIQAPNRIGQNPIPNPCCAGQDLQDLQLSDLVYCIFISLVLSEITGKQIEQISSHLTVDQAKNLLLKNYKKHSELY